MEPLFSDTNDDFMKILKVNYAKIIYSMVDMPFEEHDPSKQAKLPIRRIKKSIAKADDFEKEILALLYGSVGILATDAGSEKNQFSTDS